jgi:glycosyltransferase involved in cell wall biosynthesis
MNFLILSQNAGSRNHGMVLRNYNWAKTLVDMGYEVTVVASSFSHSRQTQPEANKGWITEENIDGIRYLWLWGPRYSAQSSLGRVFSMFVFVLQLFFPDKRLKENYDVVVLSSPPPFAIYPAHRLAKKKRAKLIFDVRDLCPLTLKELGGYSARHPFVWLMQKAEDYACRNADLVTAVARNSENYLKSRGLGENLFIPVGNGLLETKDINKPTPLSAELFEILSDIKQRAGLIVGYTGAIGLANAMDTLIYATVETDDSIHILLVGAGPEVEELRNLCHDLGIENRVHFVGSVKPDQVATCLEFIDVAYVGLLNRRFYEFGASLTKLNDYMNAAKPIIYAAEDIHNAVEQSGCGICCPAQDAAAVAEALTKMADLSVNDRRELGEKGKLWLYENNTVLGQMTAMLSAIKHR